MPQGSKPGERRGGRQKGTPNKSTAEVKKLAGKYGPKAIEKLADIAGLTRKKAAESEQARVSALTQLLDRAYGKASQATVVQGDEDNPVVTEIRMRLIG